jgi:hypothetical protein
MRTHRHIQARSCGSQQRVRCCGLSRRRSPYDLIDPMLPLDAERHTHVSCEFVPSPIWVLDTSIGRWDNGGDN